MSYSVEFPQATGLASRDRYPALLVSDKRRDDDRSLARRTLVSLHALWDISPGMRLNAEKQPKYGPTTAAFGVHRSTVSDSVLHQLVVLLGLPHTTRRRASRGLHKDVRDEPRRSSNP